MSTNKRTFGKGVVCICIVAACVATAAVLAQPQIRAFDTPGEREATGWGRVTSGATLFMRTTEPATMSALDASGTMVKAANLPHDVQVVQGVGSKTLLQIDHEQWGRSTVELDLPVTPEVWLEISFDDLGRANVSILNQNQLMTAVGAPPAQRVSPQDCGDCDAPHDTPGCSDPACEALVCDQDTFCCTVEWDQFCVNMALAKCDCPGGGGNCAACPDEAVVNDSQVGLTGSLLNQCEGCCWTSLAFPIQTGGADVDTILSVHNTNTGDGDIYIMGGTCDGPDVTDIKWVCCCGIRDAPSGVEISNSSGFPISTSDTDPTWVVMVWKSNFSFDVAFDGSTLGTSGAAYGNLSGLGYPNQWEDLNNYGFGACYFVDLALTGNPASECPCAPQPPPANDDCENAEALDVAPGGTACVDGTTIAATLDPVECVTPTTAPGVWYRVIGTGNGMTATTCEDFPPAGADYDTKISVFCGECPALSNCCTAWGGIGCDDPTCEGIVCAQDSYCCAVAWDSICANQAETKCGDLCSGGGNTETTCVTGNDDACGASLLHSTVEWCSQAGAEYKILVHGFGAATGDFTLCVSDDGIKCPYDVECIPGPPTGACCQCDGPDLFCTQETEEDCLALTGDPENFLGVGTSCYVEPDYLVYESSPNLVIPDESGQYVCDTITVTDSMPITDLNVDLVIDHTWLGDLCVTLTKDGGSPAELVRRINLEPDSCDGTGCCGCSGDDMDVILDDEAPESIEDQCASPITGTYRPDPGQLSDFDGLDTAGNWTLCVNDNAGPDVGTLVHWALHFELPGGGPEPCDEALPDKCTEEGATLDIKPGSCPNSYNNKGLGNGKLPVALVGTDDFDVTMVDPDSLLLSRADGVGGSVAPLMGPPGPGITISDTATPFDGEPCDCHELEGDGIADLNLKFHRTTMTDVLELGDLPGNSMVELVLTGTLTNGQEFEARDCIRLVSASWGGAN